MKSWYWLVLPWHRLESLCYQFKELFEEGAWKPGENDLKASFAAIPYFFCACWSLAQGSFRVTVRLKTGAPGALSF